MKNITKILAFASAFFLLAASPALAGKKDPVAVLSQAEGVVEYQKQGKKKWRKIRRNKFLFDGYTVRTGDKGSAKLTNKITGETSILGANSEIQITTNAIRTVKGKLTKSDSSKLAASLMKRFDKSQSYTTVRRSHSKKVKKIDAAKQVVLSDEHPFMVWETLGKGYSYKLTVGKDTYEVSPVASGMVRQKIKPFSGTKTYKIDAYKNGKKSLAMKPFTSKGKKTDRTATWLAGSDKDKLNTSLSALQKEYPDNLFMVGNYLEDQGLYVAAMDQYKQYLADNPDEIEMTPYLFRVYRRLKLDKIYKKELEEYKANLLE